MTTSQLNMVDIFHCHLGAKGQIGQRLGRAGPAFVEIDAPMFIGLLLLSRAKCPQAPRLLDIKIIILYTYLHVYFIPNTKL